MFGFRKETKTNEGGLMDGIRCDEASYLIWKWRPKGQEINTTKKENAIRYGSSLNVKDGEVAVFVYHQKDGQMQDFIEGPYSDTIKTGNFPVLSKIVGLAFGGGSPFQAEVYYINTAGLIQIPFAIPYFDVFDPRLPDTPVSIAVRGSFAFGISDYRAFIKLHRLANFELETFKGQLKDCLIKSVKGVVTNIPDGSYGGNPIPIVQLERKIEQINEIVQGKIEQKLADIYGVTLKDFNISVLDIDKTCDGFQKLKSLTADYAEASLKLQQDINLKNMQASNELQMNALKQNQTIQLENMKETMRINREEGQYAQRQATDVNAYAARLGAEQQNIGAFAVKNQTRVGVAAADAMGKAGSAGIVNLGGGNGNGGINPGAMMANMAMGTAVGSGMAGMLGNAFASASTGMGAGIMPGMGVPNQVSNQPQTPPPLPPNSQYFVNINGSPSGPLTFPQIQQMALSGQVNQETLVWKNGMSGWTEAGTVAELSSLFATPSGMVPPPLK